MIIGDTPAQLGQIEAADAMMIDGKIVTRDDYRAMAAQVEVLQAHRKELLDLIYNCAIGQVAMSHVVDAESLAQSAYSITGIDAASNRKPDDTTPQHYLRQVRADAVVDAIDNGFTPEQFHALKDSRDGVQLRADAGRDGYLHGAKEWCFNTEICITDIEKSAERHSASILAGKE